MRRQQTRTMTAAAAITIATIGYAHTAWATFTTLCVDPLAPCYRVGLTVPGGNFDNLNQPTGIIDALSGVDGVGGSGTAFGRAQLGTLGAKAVAVNAGLPRFNDIVFARSDVRWSDVFRFPGVVVQPSLLQFTFDLHGSTSASGRRNGGFVQALLDLRNEVTLESADTGLGGPGTVTLSVHIHQFDIVDLGLGLIVEADALDPGGATSDFLNTLGVTKVALADLNGHFLQDVTLTDFAGNTLLGQSSPGAVLEPGTLPLLALGFVAILACGTARGRTRSRRHPGRGATSEDDD
jgi:hypothetical protein